MNAAAKHAWAVEELRRAQVRRTLVRDKVLACLARQTMPITLDDINGGAELAGQFDGATVYRTLALLVELEIARPLQFQGRQTFFVLNAPGECFSFLLCRCCGAIQRIPHTEELDSLERQMTETHGYANLTHKLELYGACPDCQEHTQSCHKPTKLMSGLRLHGRFNT